MLCFQSWGNRGSYGQQGGGGGGGAGGNFNNNSRWGGNQGGGRGGGRNHRNAPLPPGHKHVLVDVPANKCGLIIGKGNFVLQFLFIYCLYVIKANHD